MSSKVEKILAKAANFDKLASDSLVSEAKKKEKVDPKAKVRNRGTVCVPAENAKDKKDHFPINDENQARNALARVNQYSSVPDWYNGSLQSLVSLVSRKVHSKYPSIKETKDSKTPGKKAYVESFVKLINKFAQATDPTAAQNLTNSFLQSVQSINSQKNLTPEQVSQQAQEVQDNAWRNLNNNPPLITQEQFTQIVNAVKAKREETSTVVPAAKVPAKPRPAPIPYREDVWQAQRRLQRPPFNVPGLVADGKLGPLTRAALKVYKSHVGIPNLEDEVAIRALKDLPEEGSNKPETAPTIQDRMKDEPVATTGVGNNNT